MVANVVIVGLGIAVPKMMRYGDVQVVEKIL